MLRLLISSGRRLRWNRLDINKRLRKWRNGDNRLKNRKSRWRGGSWLERCRNDKDMEDRYYWLMA